MGSGKILFIDRDGVLNQDYVGDYVKRWEDFIFLPGVLASLARLKKAGFSTVLISNQAGIGDGVYKKEQLDDITARMLEKIKKAGGEIADYYYCLHGKEAGCDCRKPKPGLFKPAQGRWHFEPSKTFYIGDKLSDIQAGRSFGMRTIMVMTGYGRTHIKETTPDTAPEFSCADFNEAVEIVLKETV